MTQTVYKYMDIEADNESAALVMANKMLEEGAIHFDDEPFLKVECNIMLIPNQATAQTGCRGNVEAD